MDTAQCIRRERRDESRNAGNRHRRIGAVWRKAPCEREQVVAPAAGCLERHVIALGVQALVLTANEIDTKAKQRIKNIRELLEKVHQDDKDSHPTTIN